jgi:hypothetical protein
MVALYCAEATPANVNINRADKTTVRDLFISIPPCDRIFEFCHIMGILIRRSNHMLMIAQKVEIQKNSSFRRKPESRVPGENRDPVFEMVPDFRRDDVCPPAPATELIGGSLG